MAQNKARPGDATVEDEIDSRPTRSSVGRDGTRVVLPCMTAAACGNEADSGG